jgi:hypothetical protein
MRLSRTTRYAVAFLVADTLSVGAGMGVPIFAILLGFVVGWFLPGVVVPAGPTVPPTRRDITKGALLASLYTFLLMLIIWGPTVPMLWDSQADLANFGIPMILYEPLASFIGWEVLMIAISPFLQLLAIVFAADLRLLRSET